MNVCLPGLVFLCVFEDEFHLLINKRHEGGVPSCLIVA